MTPERWKRTEELYHAAHALLPGERVSFLAEACPDDEALRRDVESLLNEQGSDDGFLAAPAVVVSDVTPAAMTGRSLGGYHLQGLIGAGGMGEVYRAHDTKLGRDVAIKILPREFTSDPDRLARFEREARMLAALNHPNICAIYGLDEAESVRFLILELVDGDTLAKRLGVSRAQSRGSGLPLREALTIARQIADALEVAHDKGIVHRDLKPANINITPDGVVKVLDFGLGRAGGGERSTPDLTHAPEATRSDGRAGAVMGTAAYMSPEQARGLPVDKRTDIWAFGCVLYEMLTGRVAFAGETVSDSIAKILEREPDWSALPATTPAPIRRLLLRCLAKDPKKRLKDIGDVRIEIDAIDEVLPGLPQGVHPATLKTRRTWLPWAALVALAAGVGVWEVRRPVAIEVNPAANAAAEDPLSGAVFTRFTDWPETEEGAEISPDGKSVAFLSDREGEVDLWRSQVGSEHFDNLTRDIPRLDAPGILRASGFFADGLELWFGGNARPNMRIPQTGGTARPFQGENAKTPAWSADGSHLAYFTQTAGDPLSVSDGTSTDARPIKIDWSHDADNRVHNHNPVWSPDNQWIYFVHGVVREWNHVTDEMDIWRVAPAGGSPERLTYLNTGLSFLAALDARTLIYVAREANGSGPWLWTLDVPSKVSRRVRTGLESYTSVSASRDGRRIAASRVNPTVSLWTVPIQARPAGDRDVQRYLVETARALAPRYGRTSSLFYLSGRGTGDGVWRFQDGKSYEVSKGAEDPLFEAPAPSADGRRVAVVRKREGKHRLTIMWANGTEPRTLAPSIDIQGAVDWSPEGDWIVAGGKDAGGRQALFKIPVDGDGELIRLVEGGAVSPVWSPVWSPDGTLIVYSGPFSAGQVSLFGVQPDGTPVTLPSERERVCPGGYRFLRNGTGLVYLPRPDSLDFWLLDFVTKQQPRQLTRLSYEGSIRGFDITPDGKHIVFDRVRQNGDIVLIDLAKK